MEIKQFKYTITQFLKTKEFQKEGTHYIKSSSDVTLVLGLQKSSYSNAYYINIGYIFNELHSSNDKVRDIDGDIRARFNYTNADKTTDLFVLDSLLEESQLINYLEENYSNLIKGACSIEGMKNLLKKRPTMLYQTTFETKKFLNI